ncbi:hypothetical protein BCIN_05g08200 [Botrytis cinerea B05.10]|uniref:Uncharacterized protein n=1 Tax=Botryotinia fuckeliana (strain B05.10) TaxID=332648 RepID=A0A384JJ34_BOTFB|nr:hypothetical protein BCIN_05g08200 [Botrytis cinerea B05.10]ATZ50471.1 hypothetical protein BCIN_05g08200 [Botrytis cinerea B05.10]
MKAPTYLRPCSNSSRFQTQRQLPPFAPQISRHDTQHPPQSSTQSQQQLPLPDHHTLTPISPSNSSPFLRIPSGLDSSILTPAPQSKLQALPQSQCLESVLNHADAESLKALLSATGNLYPHMRTTTLRFLLGDKYVEEEKEVGWSIKEPLNNNKVDGKSLDQREISMNSRKERIIPGKGLIIDLVSDDEDTLQRESPLERALMIEKKRTAVLLQELKAAKEEIKNVQKKYQNEWNQVETLQQQLREIHAKAMSGQNTSSELMPRNDSTEQALKADRRYNGIIQKQLIDETKETTRLEDLLDRYRRFQSSSVTPVSQPDKIPQTVLAETPNKEIGDLKKALKEKKTRSQWFKKQFTDQQIKCTEAETRASSVIVDKNSTVEALGKEKKKTKYLEKALKIERRLREVTERTLTHERDLAEKGEGVPLARKVLAEL